MMIDTLMAIWNRGYGGRSMLVFFAFVLVCISISLLLVTTGSSWWALFPHGGSPRRTIINGAYLTATAQFQHPGPAADSTAEKRPTATATANPCLLTPAVSKTPAVLQTQMASGNGPKGSSSGSTGTGSASGGQQPTPVKTTPTPTPRPRPTLTATAEPSPTPGVTPTPIPTKTPTPGVTPTQTPTPVPTATPMGTPTPTPGITPTVPPTSTPVETPTVVPTLPILTPTVSRAGGSPTSTISGTNTNGQNSITPAGSAGPGGPVGSHQGSKGNGWNTNCLSTSIAYSGDHTAIPSLTGDLWLILGGASLCTLLFCAGISLLSRRR